MLVYIKKQSKTNTLFLKNNITIELILLLLATCLWVEDIDAILVFIVHCLPIQVSQSTGCMRRLHDMRRLHHLSQERYPT